MRRELGFNTDIWQTNLLNLLVVFGVVVTVVGDAAKQRLDDRRARIARRQDESTKIRYTSQLAIRAYKDNVRSPKTSLRDRDPRDLGPRTSSTIAVYKKDVTIPQGSFTSKHKEIGYIDARRETWINQTWKTEEHKGETQPRSIPQFSMRATHEYAYCWIIETLECQQVVIDSSIREIAVARIEKLKRDLFALNKRNSSRIQLAYARKIEFFQTQVTHTAIHQAQRFFLSRSVRHATMLHTRSEMDEIGAIHIHILGLVATVLFKRVVFLL